MNTRKTCPKYEPNSSHGGKIRSPPDLTWGLACTTHYTRTPRASPILSSLPLRPHSRILLARTASTSIMANKLLALPQELFDAIVSLVISTIKAATGADSTLSAIRASTAGLPLICRAFDATFKHIIVRASTARIVLEFVRGHPRIANATLANSHWFIEDGRVLEAEFPFIHIMHAHRLLLRLAGAANNCKSLERVKVAVGIPRPGSGTSPPRVIRIREIPAEYVGIWAAREIRTNVDDGGKAVEIEVVEVEMDGRLHWLYDGWLR